MFFGKHCHRKFWQLGTKKNFLANVAIKSFGNFALGKKFGNFALEKKVLATLP